MKKSYTEVLLSINLISRVNLAQIWGFLRITNCSSAASSKLGSSSENGAHTPHRFSGSSPTASEEAGIRNRPMSVLTIVYLDDSLRWELSILSGL